jgi:PAS domain S-box-containing protein
VHPDDLPFVVERFTTAVRDHVDFVAESRVRHADGTWRWIMAYGAPHFAADGTFLGHVGSSPDITPLKHTEEALRLKEAHLQLLSDTVPALISYVDPGLRYRSCNQGYTTLLGLAPGGLIGRPVREVTGEEVWKIVGPRLEAALAGETVEYEAETRFPAGDLHWIRSVFTPHRDGQGNVIGIITFTTDITKAKHAEQAVVESELRFRTMAEVAPVMIWVSDAKGNIEFVNRAYREFLGMSEEQLHSTEWQLFVHPEDVPTYVEPAMRAVRERTSFAGECRVRHADGSWRWISTSAAVRLSSDGEFLGHVGCSPDITELKRAEQTLKLADRRKDEFLATLAHELRNPLAPIRTSLEVLRRSQHVRDEFEELRPMMERQIKHMMHLIDDLFDISRITAGKIRLQRQPTRLTDLVYQAVEVNRAAIEEAGLHLSVNLPPVPCLLDVDPTRFVQVLSNLLDNATKFTHRGGQIVVSADLDEGAAGPGVALTVRDTGVGIAPATLPYVFDLFTQGDSGDRTSVGLGIGLALARQLVEMLGGRIEVQSEGPGHGSAFTIRMPIVTDSTPAHPPTTQGAPAGPRTA